MKLLNKLSIFLICLAVLSCNAQILNIYNRTNYYFSVSNLGQSNINNCLLAVLPNDFYMEGQTNYQVKIIMDDSGKCNQEGQYWVQDMIYFKTLIDNIDHTIQYHEYLTNYIIDKTTVETKLAFPFKYLTQDDATMGDDSMLKLTYDAKGNIYIDNK